MRINIWAKDVHKNSKAVKYEEVPHTEVEDQAPWWPLIDTPDKSVDLITQDVAVKVVESEAPDVATEQLVQSVHCMPDSTKAYEKDHRDSEDKAISVLFHTVFPFILAAHQVPEAKENRGRP